MIHPTNPIDLGDVFDFTLYTDVMAAVCRDPEVDAVLFHYGPIADFERETARKMARRMLKLAGDAQKPLAITVLCTPDEENYLRDTLGVPVFHFPEDAVAALALSRDLAARRESLSPPAMPPLPQADAMAETLAGAHPGGFLPLAQALTLIESLGISLASWAATATPEAATAAAGRLGFPVVLKLSAPSLIHKTEAGGVELNVHDAVAVEASLRPAGPGGSKPPAAPRGLAGGGHVPGSRGPGTASGSPPG